MVTEAQRGLQIEDDVDHQLWSLETGRQWELYNFVDVIALYNIHNWPKV